jgi:hypothetical protein
MKKIEGILLIIMGVDMFVILGSVLGGIIDRTQGIFPEFLWFLLTATLLSGGWFLIMKNIIGMLVEKVAVYMGFKISDSFFSSASFFVGMLSMTYLLTVKAFSYEEYPMTAAAFFYEEVAFAVGFGLITLFFNARSGSPAPAKDEKKKEESKSSDKPKLSDEEVGKLLREEQEGREKAKEAKKKLSAAGFGGDPPKAPEPKKDDEKKDSDKK